ncbi:hypothetical protein QJS10_CPB12g01333 [Acorus calamus]|uniref:Small nuclear ribonucleoprotein Sm D3 n=1 Tax=Acorus calamus TaxID=4465 RepID=A0AAV9DMH8_ACOCL|nr:hypothetical protein QJS10_CPB12g01333 [Acorus calamus]
MSRSLGIPVKLLHEAAGHIVTVELKSGELYRGSMIECEDNWNCQLESITYTSKDGKVSQLEHVFIRGSKVRFMVIPDMLKNAPMFKRLDAKIKGKGSAPWSWSWPCCCNEGKGPGCWSRWSSCRWSGWRSSSEEVVIIVLFYLQMLLGL